VAGLELDVSQLRSILVGGTWVDVDPESVSIELVNIGLGGRTPCYHFHEPRKAVVTVVPREAVLGYRVTALGEHEVVDPRKAAERQREEELRAARPVTLVRVGDRRIRLHAPGDLSDEQRRAAREHLEQLGRQPDNESRLLELLSTLVAETDLLGGAVPNSVGGSSVVTRLEDLPPTQRHEVCHVLRSNLHAIRQSFEAHAAGFPQSDQPEGAPAP
jgi:hypothetical protein